jgi:hypothetical protein
LRPGARGQLQFEKAILPVVNRSVATSGDGHFPDMAQRAFKVRNASQTGLTVLNNVDQCILSDEPSKIPRLHLDAVEVEVRHVDVPRLRRKAARINAGTAVVEFLAAPMWQREAVIPVADAFELGGLF